MGVQLCVYTAAVARGDGPGAGPEAPGRPRLCRATLTQLSAKKLKNDPEEVDVCVCVCVFWGEG